MGKIVYLIDRSRVVDREDCPRMRYLRYDYDGTGLESEKGSLPLLSGIAIHVAHARLLTGENIDVVVNSTMEAFKKEVAARGLLQLQVTQEIIVEQAALLEGMLRVWQLIRMPQILAEYDVLSIEEPEDWELSPGLVTRMRKDVRLRRKDDRLKFILDFKTLSYPSELWADKFEHDHQTNLYLLSELEKHPDEPLGGILYEGLVKGQFKKDTAFSSPFYGQKTQQSPYTQAWALKEGPLAFYQTAYTSKKGYTKVKPYLEMSVKAWVENWLIPEGNPQNLFIVVPPIMPPRYEMERLKSQVVKEEIKYHDKLAVYRNTVQFEDEISAPLALSSAELLNEFAPIRTGRCHKFGQDHKCIFLDVCFNQGVDPLAEDSGFKRRVPHHDVDMTFIA